MLVSAGVFAYNEAASIGAVIAQIAEQDVFASPGHEMRVTILANGCTDDTAGAARRAIDALPQDRRDAFEVVEYAEGGKARTWNRFVHEAAPAEADHLLFIDGDIEIVFADAVTRMIAKLAANPQARVVTSLPVKDTAQKAMKVGLVGKLTTAFSGTYSAADSAIAGSFYMARREALADIWMPVGLPVEDGFLRGMILTDLLTRPEELSRVTRADGLHHLYEAVTSWEGIVDHQTRIVLGSAVNTAVFTALDEQPRDVAARAAFLREAFEDDGWLARLLDERLPTEEYGYVPTSFKTKRFATARGGAGKAKLPLLSKALLAYPFDALVYDRATRKMKQGVGAGHW